MTESEPSFEQVGERPESPKPRPVNGGPTRRQELEHRVRLNATNREAYLELARIYRSENHPLQASKTLKQAHEMFPDDPTILWEWEEAQLARSLEQFTTARDLVNQFANPAAEQELGRSRMDWANCRIRICRARLLREPVWVHLHLVVGEALFDLERYQDAIDEVASLADVDTHSPAAALVTGRCQIMLGNDVDAMKSLRHASMRRSIEIPPNIRHVALKSLVGLAERHQLTATLELYQSLLPNHAPADASS